MSAAVMVWSTALDLLALMATRSLGKRSTGRYDFPLCTRLEASGGEP